MLPRSAPGVDDGRRQRIRRNVLLLAGLALAFYLGFIYLVVTRGP